MFCIPQNAFICILWFAEFDELGPSIDKLKLPIPRPTSTDYGAHVSRLPSRQSQRGDRNQPLSESHLRCSNNLYHLLYMGHFTFYFNTPIIACRIKFYEK